MPGPESQISTEDEDHLLGGSAFLEEDFVGAGNAFLALAGQPEAVFEGQPVERTDAIESAAIASTGVGEAVAATAGESIRAG
jgi:hypothetical protein